MGGHSSYGRGLQVFGVYQSGHGGGERMDSVASIMDPHVGFQAYLPFFFYTFHLVLLNKLSSLLFPMPGM